MPTTVAVMHPGEMGAAIGLTDVGTVDRLATECDVVLSVCPPHAAAAVAQEVSGFHGTFVDANAVSPGTVREIAAVVSAHGAAVVDGGIIGPPPATTPDETRLYLAGAQAGRVADLFAPTPVDTRVVDGEIGAASALKMAYAAWTKGTAALLLAIRALAREERVEDALASEWDMSLSGLADRTKHAARSAATKGWRWIAEMEEIAATFADAGLPDGFHRAAAEVYRRSPRLEPTDAAALDRVIEAVRRPA